MVFVIRNENRYLTSFQNDVNNKVISYGDISLHTHTNKHAKNK